MGGVQRKCRKERILCFTTSPFFDFNIMRMQVKWTHFKALLVKFWGQILGIGAGWN